MRKIESIYTLSLFLIICCSPKKIENDLEDFSKIERITDPWDVDILYQDSIFFINKDLKALIQAYKNNSLIFESFNTKIIYNGNSMMGNGSLSKRMLIFKEELIEIQTYPHQITRIDFKGKIKDQIPIKLKNTIQILDGFLLTEESIGLVTFPSVEQTNQLQLIAYNLNHKDASILFSKKSSFPANTNLIRTNNSFIFILNPYEKNLIVLNKKGKLVEEAEFKNINISLDYKPPYPFTTPDEYFALSPAEQLATRPDNVYDFYFNKGILYLLVRRLSIDNGNKIVSKSELLEVELQSQKVSEYSGNHIFLSFDFQGNVFRYYKENEEYKVDILPIDKITKRGLSDYL